MADYVATQSPGIGMIGYARPSHQISSYMLGDPTYTSAAKRFFGQPHISKGMGPTPALNPSFGNRHFAYNWGADNAFSGRTKGSWGCQDSFTANFAKDFSLVNEGPNNIPSHYATARPDAHWGLYQVDDRIQRGSQPTDVGENNYPRVAYPTSDGRTLSFWGKSVTSEKQEMNLKKYKEVQRKLGY